MTEEIKKKKDAIIEQMGWEVTLRRKPYK